MPWPPTASRSGRRPSASSARTISGRSSRRPAARWHLPVQEGQGIDGRRPVGHRSGLRVAALTGSACWRGRRVHQPPADHRRQLVSRHRQPVPLAGLRPQPGNSACEKFAGPQEPVIILVHLACPRVKYTDRGKSAIVMNSTAGCRRSARCGDGVTSSWTRQRKAELRDPSREISRRDALTRRRRVTIKDAAWQVMGAAYRHASANGTLPAHARQIMYAARPDILRLTRPNSSTMTTSRKPSAGLHGRPSRRDGRVGCRLRRPRPFREPHTDRRSPSARSTCAATCGK